MLEFSDRGIAVNEMASPLPHHGAEKYRDLKLISLNTTL